jgi:hypothetical protein
MSVIRLPPKPGHQSLGEGLHILLDVVREEWHPGEQFVFGGQVQPCQSRFPAPIEVLACPSFTPSIPGCVKGH